MDCKSKRDCHTVIQVMVNLPCPWGLGPGMHGWISGRGNAKSRSLGWVGNKNTNTVQGKFCIIIHKMKSTIVSWSSGDAQGGAELK
jgi:hypothetical protein